MSFTSLGLAEPILRAVSDKGYTEPSPIQAKAIPAVMSGRDLMAAAQTGTGKTAGFTLPILHRLAAGRSASPNQCRALVLTPTRELAAQVGENVAEYGRYLTLRSTVVFGGVKINPQMMALRKGVDVLVATPGRLLDLYNQNAVKFDQLEVLVLDEADRMLDMGFIHDIRRILKALPAKRQNLLFSATFSADIKQLAATIVNDPVSVEVSPPNSTATTVKQWLHPVDKKRKPALLSHLIQEQKWQQVLVFTRTKHGANRLAQTLEKDGIKSMAIHGNKSQGARTKALAGFKKGEVRVLVATDIAARGLDIDQLPQVVNFELPNVPEDYVHRIGRTGRAGASGQAVSLVCADEFKELAGIERLIRKKLKREYVDDFEPQHELPDLPLGAPPKPKKPKKPKPPRTSQTGNSSSSAKPRGGSEAGTGRRRGGNPGQAAKSAQGGNSNPHSGNRSDANAPAKRRPRRRSRPALASAAPRGNV
ncbi:DEAD/DEAH box helicase [Motiliproteus sediminis]|uniref:DEAD/DEAH box helicase n=1 Tax=Motiliproteus sediminis TaxID=1468178 RepID=UPI001AEFC54E|nr:DEAD/DEAH box helicase [Motiliproteus sediminis]